MKKSLREQEPGEIAQAYAGNTGAAAGGIIGAKLANKPARWTAKHTKKRVAGVAALSAKQAGLTGALRAQGFPNAHRLVRGQARAIAGMAAIGGAAATRAAGGLAGALAGDATGDLAAAQVRTRIAGEKPSTERRQASVYGLALGGLAGTAAQGLIEARRKLRYTPKRRFAIGAALGGIVGGTAEVAGNYSSQKAEARLSKRAGDGQVTEAERQQRVNAAKARWANRSTMGADTDAAPAKKPWTGQQLGLGREVRVQAQSMLNPVWQHNYQGAEWGYGRDGAPKEAGGKTYLSLNRKPQKPKGMTDAQFIELGRWANGVANDRRADIIAEGLGQEIIGEDGRNKLKNRKGQPYRFIDEAGQEIVVAREKHIAIPKSKRDDKEAINLAFNHARMLAMNDVGLIRVDPGFRLTPEAKEKLYGMERFMRNARRAISNDLRNGRGEVWSQIREEHGDTFADGRLGPDGKPKRFFPYHANMVKRWGAGALMKRKAGTPLSEAEIEQRREAAKKRMKRQGDQFAAGMAGGYAGAAAGLAGTAAVGIAGNRAIIAGRTASQNAVRDVGRAMGDFEREMNPGRPSRSRALVTAREPLIISPKTATIMRRGEDAARAYGAANRMMQRGAKAAKVARFALPVAVLGGAYAGAKGGVSLAQAQHRREDEGRA